LSSEQSIPSILTETDHRRVTDKNASEGPGQVEGEGLIPIKAPLLGIFYRAPKPGAPPFVEVGDHVTEEDTVCLVEVMKLFNTVKAGINGRIAKICAENSQMVEYNQILFLIDPTGTPKRS
jgi:acetyl-CoA carboxylase biotin carboxyl carrier protein